MYRLFLLALHHLGYHLELSLQLSIRRALALQPIYLLLQRSPRSVQIKDLRQLASLSLRHAVELPPEVAVEIVNEREQKVAVELGDGRLAEGLSPLLDYVLDEAADNKVRAVGVPRAQRFLHKLDEIGVVPFLVVLDLLNGGQGRGAVVPCGHDAVFSSFAILDMLWLALLGGLHGHLVDGDDVLLVGEGPAERAPASFL